MLYLKKKAVNKIVKGMQMVLVTSAQLVSSCHFVLLAWLPLSGL